MTVAEPALAPIPDAAARPEVRLLPGRQKRLRAGHPWIFSNEIAMTAEAKAIPAGSIVALVDSAGTRLATATFNPRPLISARVLDRASDAEIDREFVAGRLRKALALRERLFEAPYYRLVWSEADGLPGLVLDRYGDVLVAQINTAGMDRLAPILIEAMEEVLDPTAIVLRNDSAARTLEGLEEAVEIRGSPPDGPVAVVENGVRFLCDPAGGQKTGWFFDHRENRARVARLAKDQRVLDVFSYLGGFGLQAAAAGAESVTCIDRSAPALALAAAAAQENGVDERCTFVRGDAFPSLEALAKDGERFGIVIADPPAFVKSKKDLPSGLKGYRKLFREAARLVAPDGLLFAASCSHHVDAGLFAEAVRGALRDANRGGRILDSGGAGPDHPVHPYLPESAYLKTALLQLD